MKLKSVLVMAGLANRQERPATEASKSEAAMEALRWAKQAEVSAAAHDRERFMEQIEGALEAALIGGGQAPDHRVAESVHALMEARALVPQGKMPQGREDLQSAIVWLTRAAGLPVETPAADWSTSGRGAIVHGSQRKEASMDHFLIDIEEATIRNENFREVPLGDGSALVIPAERNTISSTEPRTDL